MIIDPTRYPALDAVLDEVACVDGQTFTRAHTELAALIAEKQAEALEAAADTIEGACADTLVTIEAERVASEVLEYLRGQAAALRKEGGGE